MKGKKIYKRNIVYNFESGRNVRLVKYKKNINQISVIHSILKSINNNGDKFIITEKDLVGWEKQELESLNLILLIDLSKSIFKFVKIFSQLIESLTGYFNINKDRIGLICLQGLQAKILNHPTHNYRIINKSLLSLKVEGLTPLSDGMQKALSMAKLEKFKNSGSKNLVVLLSDCYPEPLTGKFNRILDEPMYRECISASKQFKKDKVSLLLIYPNFIHNEDEEEIFYPGEKLATLIIKNSNGKMFKFKKFLQYRSINTTPEQFKEQEIDKILLGIEKEFNKQL